MGLFDKISDLASSVADTASDAASSVADTASDIASSVADTASDAASSVGGFVSDDIVGVASDVLRESTLEPIIQALTEDGAMSVNRASSVADEVIGRIDFVRVFQRINFSELSDAIDGISEPEQLETVSSALESAIAPELGAVEGVADVAEVAAAIAESAAPEILPLLLLV